MARDLTMGKRRGHQRKPGTTGEYAQLRQLTKGDDAAALYAMLRRLEASPQRQRFGEAAAILDGWTRWRELTGGTEGRVWGHI
jgi:hypothetical protein